VIVDERPLWLDALEGLLKRLEFDVVGRATGPGDGHQIVANHAPDLVIVDSAALANDVANPSLLQSARQANPTVRCIVLSENDDPDERERAFAAGASVFCVKRAQADDLAAAIRQSFEHLIYYAATPRSSSEPAMSPGPSQPDAAVGLTKREVEILCLAAEGHSNSQLAAMLWVTEQTVKFHLSNIYRKLGVANRTEASRWAQRNGLLNLEDDTTAAA
jgi:DNA-binding NarL/FixJ family response regulator